MYTTNGVVLSVIARSGPGQPVPDLFCYALIGRFAGYFPGYSKLVSKNPNCLTWVVLKGHTNNTAGAVTLRSADPRDAPAVNFHYFDEGNDSASEDVRAVVKGVKFVRKMAGGLKGRGSSRRRNCPARRSRQTKRSPVRAGQRVGPPRVVHVPDRATRRTAAWCRATSRCTARRGCASWTRPCFRASPASSSSSAVYMIGEKAADVIAKDAGEVVPAFRPAGTRT